LNFKTHSAYSLKTMGKKYFFQVVLLVSLGRFLKQCPFKSYRKLSELFCTLSFILRSHSTAQNETVLFAERRRSVYLFAEHREWNHAFSLNIRNDITFRTDVCIFRAVTEYRGDTVDICNVRSRWMQKIQLSLLAECREWIIIQITLQHQIYIQNCFRSWIMGTRRISFPKTSSYQKI
jgi:hypothetical protein